MKLIILGLVGLAVAVYFGIKYPMPFLRSKKHPDVVAVSSSSPPTSQSPVSRPRRPRPDRGLSWWGVNGRITGGQGETGYVYERSPDRIISGTPYWVPLANEVPFEPEETGVHVPRGTEQKQLEYLGLTPLSMAN